jgi:hypothetical protein
METLMNRIKKSIFMILFCLFFSLPCQAQDCQTDIIGKWFFADFLDEMVIIEFTENLAVFTRIEYGGNETAECKIVNNKLIFETVEWDYKFIDKNTLALIFPNIDYIGKRLRDQNITSLNGEFILTGKIGFIKSIKFIDNKQLILTGGAGLNYGSISGEYEIKFPYLIIEIENKLIALKIISDNILKGDPSGIGGDYTFIREEN